MSATATTATSVLSKAITPQQSEPTPKAPEIIYQENPTTIIVGMGPAGQMAIHKALKAGHRVIWLDNRAEFTRNQRLVLSPLVHLYLFSMSNLSNKGVTMTTLDNGKAALMLPSMNMFQEMELRQDPFFQFLASGDLPSIKSLQTLMLSKNSEGVNAATAVDTKTALEKTETSTQSKAQAKAQTGNPLTILRGPEFEITKLEGDKQILTVVNNKTKETLEFPFHYFIAADGAKHSMANLLAENSKYTIPYGKLPKVRHETCGSISFKLTQDAKLLKDAPKTIVSHLAENSQLKFTHLEQLQKLGWEESYLPITYITRDENNIIYMIGEMPSGMKENDMQARENWGKAILAIEFAEFGLKEKDLIFYSENGTNHNPTFKLELAIAKQNVVALGKKGGFFLIGDARQNPNFFYGHGAEDAMSDAEALFECFFEADLRYKEKSLRVTLESDHKSNTEEATLLYLVPVLKQHQRFKEHYLELNEGFINLLKILENRNLEEAEQRKKANMARKEAANIKNKKLAIHLERTGEWTVLTKDRLDAVQLLQHEVNEKEKNMEFAKFVLALHFEKEDLEVRSAARKRYISEFGERSKQLKYTFDNKMKEMSEVLKTGRDAFELKYNKKMTDKSEELGKKESLSVSEREEELKAFRKILKAECRKEFDFLSSEFNMIFTRFYGDTVKQHPLIGSIAQNQPESNTPMMNDGVLDYKKLLCTQILHS